LQHYFCQGQLSLSMGSMYWSVAEASRGLEIQEDLSPADATHSTSAGTGPQQINMQTWVSSKRIEAH
jgi:hypothetical protein